MGRAEEGRSAFKMLTGKPAGKRPLRRPRRRWDNNTYAQKYVKVRRLVHVFLLRSISQI